MASARSSLWSARRPRAKAAFCWMLGTTSSTRGRSKDITPAGGETLELAAEAEYFIWSLLSLFLTSTLQGLYVLGSRCPICNHLHKLQPRPLILLKSCKAQTWQCVTYCMSPSMSENSSWDSPWMISRWVIVTQMKLLNRGVQSSVFQLLLSKSNGLGWAILLSSVYWRVANQLSCTALLGLKVKDIKAVTIIVLKGRCVYTLDIFSTQADIKGWMSYDFKGLYIFHSSLQFSSKPGKSLRKVGAHHSQPTQTFCCIVCTCVSNSAGLVESQLFLWRKNNNMYGE